MYNHKNPIICEDRSLAWETNMNEAMQHSGVA